MHKSKYKNSNTYEIDLNDFIDSSISCFISKNK